MIKKKQLALSYFLLGRQFLLQFLFKVETDKTMKTLGKTHVIVMLVLCLLSVGTSQKKSFDVSRVFFNDDILYYYRENKNKNRRNVTHDC